MAAQPRKKKEFPRLSLAYRSIVYTSVFPFSSLYTNHNDGSCCFVINVLFFFGYRSEGKKATGSLLLFFFLRRCHQCHRCIVPEVWAKRNWKWANDDWENLVWELKDSTDLWIKRIVNYNSELYIRLTRGVNYLSVCLVEWTIGSSRQSGRMISSLSDFGQGLKTNNKILITQKCCRNKMAQKYSEMS